MNRRDAPPGHRVTVLTGHPPVEVGDLLLEERPRLGRRRWLVVLVQRARVHTHVLLAPVSEAELAAGVSAGSRTWQLVQERHREG